MGFLTRAARNISQYLGKNPIWDISGSPSLQEGCHSTSATQKKIRMEGMPENHPSILLRLKQKKRYKIKLCLHLENSTKKKKIKGEVRRKLGVSAHFVWHLHGQVMTYLQIIIIIWVYFLLPDINITSQCHFIHSQWPLTSKNIHLQLDFHLASVVIAADVNRRLCTYIRQHNQNISPEDVFENILGTS